MFALYTSCPEAETEKAWVMPMPETAMIELDQINVQHNQSPTKTADNAKCWKDDDAMVPSPEYPSSPEDDAVLI